MNEVIKVGNSLWCRYTEHPLNRDVFRVTISNADSDTFTVIRPKSYTEFEISTKTMKTDDGSVEATFNLNTWNESDAQKELIKTITDLIELGALEGKTSKQLVQIVDILSE